MAPTTTRAGAFEMVLDDGIDEALGRLLGPQLLAVADVIRTEGDLVLELGREAWPKKTGDSARGLRGDLHIDDSGSVFRYVYRSGEEYGYAVHGGDAWIDLIREPAREMGDKLEVAVVERLGMILEGG